jgi:sugar-specific transcriptional regulator TrmB
MNKEILEEIGLTKSEINVYLALLELGSSATGKIVEKSKASSSKIYEVLDKLMQKGLVSFIIKKGVKYFEAAPPERIMDYMKEKEKKLNKQKTELKKVLPELELKQKLSEFKSEATIFKGLKGGETAFKYMINSMAKKDEWLGFVVEFRDEKYFDLLTKLHSWRAKKGLKSRIIINEKHRELGKDREKLPHTKVKYVPDQEQTPAIINVAGDICLLNIMAEEVTVFLIENKRVADSFRNQFEKMWNRDTTVEKGMKALERAFKQAIDEKKPGETWDVLGGTFGVTGQEKKYADFFAEHTKRRMKKEIPIRLLLQQGAKESVAKYGKAIYKKGDQLKYLPYKTKFPVVIIPCKERTILFIQKKEPTVITINNKEVAQSFQEHFESRWDQNVRVYKGFKAVTDKFTSMLDLYKEGEEYYVLGATYGLGGDRLKEWFMGYSRYRIKKKVTGKFLITPEDRKQIIYEFTHTGDPKMKYSKVKNLPPAFSTPMQINLYKGNKVIMFLWGKEMMCFEVESEILYDNFKTYFDALWKTGRNI